MPANSLWAPDTSCPRIPSGARVVLSLLGPPQVWVKGLPAHELLGEKVLALLAYLAIECDRSHRRETLATLLWPDEREAKSLQNLRQTLSRLRRGLDDEHADPPLLLAGPQTIRFNREGDYWLDVDAFRALEAATAHHAHRRLAVCPSCLSQLARAAELSRGDFLAHIHPACSSALDEWLLVMREQLGRQTCTALQALAEARLVQGEHRAAAGYAQQLLRLDPWDESALRRLLAALVQGEGRNAALRQYEAFRRSLQQELGVEPEDETRALAALIRAGSLTEAAPGAPAARLPAAPTPLIGRQPELQQVADHLAGRERRLITLCGPGGCGKTRLALEVGSEQVRLWRDGVWFVPLAETASAAGLADALAAALGAQTPGRPTEAKELLDFLAAKELLLILDGFEHLVPDTTLLREILKWAPEVRLVVTSRVRLNLRGEWPLPLAGLKLPPEHATTLAEVEGCASVQLFVHSAQRVAPAFQLAPETVPHVARICHLVEGLPLGLELAAAWVRLYPCSQIAAEIGVSLSFLQDDDVERTPRHRSVRGTFDYSYNLLSESERSVLRRLSVFRGGCTVEAARNVTAAAPSVLDALLDRSLLQISPAHRLDLHLSVREYAGKKLAGLPAEELATRASHSRFYLAHLGARYAAITGEHSREVLDEVQEELSNIRAAFRWAVPAGAVELLSGALDALAQFYSQKGYLREATDLFAGAAAELQAAGPRDPEAERLVCRLRVQQASFLQRRGEYDAAIEAAGVAVGLAGAGGLARAPWQTLSEATAHAVWGEALWRQGAYGPAAQQLDCALALARTTPDGVKVEADCLNSLAGICWRQGDYAGARKRLEDSLLLPTHAGRTRNRSVALGNLGVVAVEQGDYVTARRYYREALEIEREIGDREGESVSLTNLGNLSLYLGAYAEAETYYQQALVMHRETGAHHSEAWTLGNVGLLAQYRGDFPAALSCAREALQMAKEIGEQPMQGTMWLQLGHALAGLGRPSEAVEAYGEALALRRKLEQANMATEPLAGLARIAHAQGDLPLALTYVAEILRHLAAEREHALDGTLGPFDVYLACYLVLAAAGDPRGREVLAGAHDLLLARAGRIADEKLRSSFLENVAANRGVIEAFGLCGELR